MSRRRCDGQRQHEVRRRSGRLAPRRAPPFTSAKPRAIARPSPRRCPSRLERPEQRSRSSARTPEPWSTTWKRSSVRTVLDTHEHAAIRAASISARSRSGSRAPARPARRRRAPAAPRRRARPAHARCLEGLADELVGRPELAVRLDRPGLEPRESSKSPTTRFKPLRLAADRRRQLARGRRRRAPARGSSARRPRRGSRSTASGRSWDDRAQQRRLQRVAAAQRLRLERVPPLATAKSAPSAGSNRVGDGVVDLELGIDEHGRHVRASAERARPAPEPGRRERSAVRRHRAPSPSRLGDLLERTLLRRPTQQVGGCVGEHARLAPRCSASALRRRARAARKPTTTAVTQ